MAPEASSLIVTLLAAETRYQALVDIVTRLRVIKELKPWWAGALSSKWSLDTVVTAASIVQRTIICIYKRVC